MIRLLVVDDHPVVRNGLVELLSTTDDIEVVAAAVNGAEAVDLAALHHPDVILMDLSMPVMGGCEATRRIVGADPEARVLVLTSFTDQEGILDAIDAGAAGYLLKDAEPSELLGAVRAVARGESPLDPKVAATLLRSRTTRRQLPELTERERQVLQLVGAGLANKQIARRLDISEKTVKAHLTSVFHRIGVSDRTQAALWAARHGLVD
ncbi:MAG: response regulator transcription factor [Actinomycetota bacterium]|nr:response regulator transcription factor [Actinomycetota bacterium]